MSEFKGTSGEWKAVNVGKHWNNKEIDNIQIQYGNDSECISDHVYCKYDALLISKAPEMLEMLKECKRVLSSVQSPATPSILLYREIQQLIKEATEL